MEHGPLDPLDEDALVRILTEPRNALVKQYQKLFEMEGAELEFDVPALREIARRAKQRSSPPGRLRLLRRDGRAVGRILRARRPIGVAGRCPLVTRLARPPALLAHGAFLSTNGHDAAPERRADYLFERPDPSAVAGI